MVKLLNNIATNKSRINFDEIVNQVSPLNYIYLNGTWRFYSRSKFLFVNDISILAEQLRDVYPLIFSNSKPKFEYLSNTFTYFIMLSIKYEKKSINTLLFRRNTSI